MEIATNLFVSRPGIYRRRIRIATAAGWARADMEDDGHRFGVIVRHDGRIVTSVEGLSVRVPWSLCPKAEPLLERLQGMPLVPHPLAVYRTTDGKVQCTHMCDLAGLAIAHAARGIPSRCYDVEAPWYRLHGPRTLTLRRDGLEVLHWSVDAKILVEPERFAGRDLRDVVNWAEREFPDADDFEAVVVLRRAVLISGARLFVWDEMPNAQATQHGLGACFVFQAGVADKALRNAGTTLDFTDRPEALLENPPSTSKTC